MFLFSTASLDRTCNCKGITLQEQQGQQQNKTEVGEIVKSKGC
jgi:hypothetical protein